MSNYSNPIFDKDLYEQVGLPDVVVLSQYMQQAKGVNRSNQEFAEICGVSAPQMSRILNAKFTQPLPFEVLVRAICHASPGVSFDFFDLLNANGLGIKGDMVNPLAQQGRSETHIQDMNKKDRELRSILLENIAMNGYSIQHVIPKTEDKTIAELVSFRGNNILALKGLSEKPRFWRFQVFPLRNVVRVGSKAERINAIDYAAEASLVLKEIAPIFLADCWNPSKMESMGVGFVFEDQLLYDMVWEMVGDKVVNNLFAFILIDRNLGTVVMEKYVHRAGETDDPVLLFHRETCFYEDATVNEMEEW